MWAPISWKCISTIHNFFIATLLHLWEVYEPQQWTTAPPEAAHIRYCQIKPASRMFCSVAVLQCCVPSSKYCAPSTAVVQQQVRHYCAAGCLVTSHGTCLHNDRLFAHAITKWDYITADTKKYTNGIAKMIEAMNTQNLHCHCTKNH